MSLNDGTGWSSPAAAFSCARSSRAASMSMSMETSKSGTVARDSAMRRATTCWVRLGCWTVASPLLPPPEAAAAGAAAGSGSGAASAGADAVPDSSAVSTSALTIRPAGPVPVSECRSIDDSRARRRATGEAFTRPPSPLPFVAAPTPAGTRSGAGAPSAAGAAAGASSGSAGAASGVAAGASAEDASAAGAAASPIVAIVAPIDSVEPSAATMCSGPSSSAS